MAFAWLAAAPLFAATAYNIFDAFRGTPNPISGDYAAAIQRANTFAAASSDPEHPWFKRVEGSLRERLRREATEQILRDIRLRTRSRAAGFPSAAFNPERRDEARSSALIRAFQQAGEQARLDTHRFLSGAANSATNAANAYFQPTQLQYASQLADREMRRRAVGSLGIMSSGIINAFQQQQAQPDYASLGYTPSGIIRTDPAGRLVGGI